MTDPNENAGRTSLLARAGLIGIAGAFGAAVLGWLRAKGLALALGPSGFGLYGQLGAFVLYAASFATLGFGVGTTALVASHRQRGEQVAIADVSRASVLIPAAVGTAFGAAALAAASLLAPLVLDDKRAWLIVIAAASIPFAAAQVPLQHVLQGFEDVGGQNVVYLLYGAVFTVAAVAGAVIAGVGGAAVGLAVGNVALAALYLTRVRTIFRRSRIPFRATKHTSGPSRALLQIGAASLAITVAYGIADLFVRTMLLHSHGQHATGYWYALLTVSVQFIGSLAGAMSYITVPLAARARAGSDVTKTRRLLDESLRLALLVIMPVLFALVALRHQLVSVLFSSSFDPIARWLPLQLTGDSLRTVGWMLGVALVPLGLTRAWLAIGIASSLIFGVVGSLAAMHWGIGGAAAAWVVTWSASAVATWVVVSRTGLWRPSRRTLIALVTTAATIATASFAPEAVGIAATLLGTAILAATVLPPREWPVAVRRVAARR